MRKLIVAALFASAFAVGTAHAQVYVRVRPPAPVYERHGPPPRPGWAWRAGYQRWNGRAYVWVPGSWAAPPRPRAVWVAGRWVHRPQGWVWMEGHWR